jgi:dynein heavy chain
VESVATDIQERLSSILPKGKFDLRDAHHDTFQKIPGGGTNSLGVFLTQEIIRFNAMLEVMLTTLDQLKRAIKGFIVMSGPLEVMYNSFVFQGVPPVWEKNGYPCLKPLPSWTEDHFQRLDLTKSWLLDGPPNGFWLSGFFFPQGFMTAVKQTYSRDYKIAIDLLMVSCVFENFERDDIKAPPQDGVYIYGLFCEAARFDRSSMVLEESNPAELFSSMPVMHLLPCMEETYDSSGTYSCPVYKTSLRFGVLSTTGHSTNQVCNFDIPTSVEAAHWTRRGTALLCMLDY